MRHIAMNDIKLPASSTIEKTFEKNFPMLCLLEKLSYKSINNIMSSLLHRGWFRMQ